MPISEDNYENYQRAYRASCRTAKTNGLCAGCDRKNPCNAAKTTLEAIEKEFNFNFDFAQSPRKCIVKSSDHLDTIGGPDQEDPF